MKIIDPITITDSIIETNVHEIAPDEWSDAVTYPAGAFAHLVNGQDLDIYESCQAGNLNKNPETEPDWWIFRSKTYAEYDPGKTYLTGDRVIVPSVHKEYESIKDDNLGNTPSSSPTFWTKLGSTNPRKCFDEKVGTQTERSGSITFSLTPGMIVDGVAFFNLDAVSVDIVVTDPVDGDVYTETIDLLSTENVYDGYTYYFAPFIFIRNFVRSELPPYSTATIHVTINAESDTATAKCGEIVFGQKDHVGGAEYGAGLEVLDFSLVKEDAYGDLEITKRSFSKRTYVDVLIMNGMMGYISEFLERNRSKPVVWVVTEDKYLAGPYLTYGIYRSNKIVAEYPDESILTLELRGLT